MSEQNEYPVPLDKDQKRKASRFLPRFYRTDANQKFLAGTIDNLIQRGTAQRLNGFIGRKNSKASKASDIFLSEVSDDRANYQLEPCLIAEDNLGNTTFFKDYIDYINTIDVLGGINNNHERLNQQEFYSWDPHINWDKFVNYLQYYWLPYGPDTVPISGTKTLDIISTYNIELVDEGDNFAYLFTPDALTRNPDLRLYRGETYRFEINVPEHPLSIRTNRTTSRTPEFKGSQSFNYTQHGVNNFTVEILSSNDDINTLLSEVYINGEKVEQNKFTFYLNEDKKNVLLLENNIEENDIVILDFFILKDNDEFRYLDGIKIFDRINDKLVPSKNFNIKNGVLEFTVSVNAPDVLYYVSDDNPDTSGMIKIFDIEENTSINVESEVIGKKSYTSNGVTLSNGMKIKFRGLVSPNFYRDKEFYVEGVGESIILVDVATLEVVNDIAYNVDVNFDSNGFDQLAFNNINYAALDKDYILINRSSLDRNPWSRYNRWFHKEVIEQTARALGKLAVFDQDKRAKRPIIEFNPNIRLFNFGNHSKANIDLLDDFTKDVFSIVEGALGYIIDGVELVNGHRVIFTADTDPRVKNKVFRVEFLDIFDEDLQRTYRRIHLAEEPDTEPELDQTVLVLAGNILGGQMFWFNGSTWQLGQYKSGLNQCPLYDIFDEEKVSLSNLSKYEGSTFKGNKLFSYKIGNAGIDSELGFSLTYRNINNIGDIVFDFNLTSEDFKYKDGTKIISDILSNKYLEHYTPQQEKRLVNGWIKNNLANVQPIVRIYKQEYKVQNDIKSLVLNDFALDIFDDYNDLDDLRVKVYINDKRLDERQYEIYNGVIYKHIGLQNDIDINDIVTIKCYTKKPKNSIGYYEFPVNFQNNPLNENIETLTLGEVIDHVDSIVDNVDNFVGTYPGSSNLRDIGQLSTKGLKFLQHSGSLNLALYHLTDKNANIIKALESGMNDYSKFKKSIIFNSEYLEEGLTPKQALDQLLKKINENKTINMPYYFSDMLAYTAHTHTQFKLKEFVQTSFPLSSIFTLEEINPKAVYIYVNNNLLLYGKDYTFTRTGFIEVFAPLKENDLVDLYEYDSTDGCFVPPTPTSLGLYPKYEPKKYVDDTFLEPRTVIQGHDGSIVLAFDDFRDDIILEFEKRIFNNIKINYDPTLIDIYDYIEGSNRPSLYNKEEFNRILSTSFFKWTTLIDQDYTKQELYLQSNPFTYNYSEVQSFDLVTLPGFWRGVYKWYYDTDRIHICPWESLGFSMEPIWWNEVYGPAPYTSDNYVLWNDLRDGIIREPNKGIRVNERFVKPVLNNIPVDSNGNLLDPIQANLATGLFNTRLEKNYIFGDISPVESAWRRSSYYPFSLLKTIILMTPNKVFSLYYDRSRIVKNSASQNVYKDTGLRIRLKDILLPNTGSTQQRTQTSGLVNYIVDYLVNNKNQFLTEYANNLKNLTNKISHRLSGYSSKEKYNLILDSRNIKSTTSVFVPNENYKIFLNTSSPTKKLFYSGVIITKIRTRYGVGYEIKGYSVSQPYFYYYPWAKPGYDINVGGISESYIIWDSNQRYIAGNIVKINELYYRVKISHTSSTNPDYDYLQKLPTLPIVGGVDANIRSIFDPIPLVLNYGTIIYNVQEVVDFLLGYGEYLKSQGFIFDTYIPELKNVANWLTSTKEFLFWITQNWSSGRDVYDEWEELTNYKVGDLVFYNRNFYQTKIEHVTSSVFDPSYYTPIDNINTEGASAISLSPAALAIELKNEYNVVDEITDFFEYEIFRADGVKYRAGDLNYYRDGNNFIIKPKNLDVGIYGFGCYLIQKEHVVVIDNLTQFNDVIYNTPTGYRQERIKVYGYKTIDWDGSLYSPGFVYDTTNLQEWTPWVDYAIGDIVKYKEFYYTASKKIPGNESFDINDWVRINETPESKLIPNWDYKSLQFLDFYDLDSDNFDYDQQRIAQHLIGYQKRQYLSNIIKNDVSEFKFYQGMITEKGTRNSLSKLFDVLGPEDGNSLTFLEEWALRVGRYGAIDAFEEVEFILDESLFKLEPQPIELVDVIDPNKVDFVIRQTPNDIFLKPNQYSNNIWPVNNNYDPLLKTPGFSKIEFAKLIIDDLSDILVEQVNETLSISDLIPGDYIWCGFEKKINQFEDDWCIYRYNKLYSTATVIEPTDTTLVIEFDLLYNFNIGDLVGFASDYNKFNQFFKIIGTDSVAKTITIDLPSGFNYNNLDQSTIETFVFTLQRFNSIDDFVIPKYLNLASNNWPYGELVWFNGAKKSIWKNYKVYQQKTLKNLSLNSIPELGSRVSVNKDSTVLLVKASNGEQWKGTWTSNVTYNLNNVVFQDQLFWTCFKPNSTQEFFNPTKTLNEVNVDSFPTNNGFFSCANRDYLREGSLIQVFGTLATGQDDGQISGYVDGNIYKIPTDGLPELTNLFKLVNLDDTELTTVDGNTTGLSFVLLGDWTETNSSNNEIVVYDKPYLSNQWSKKQVIRRENTFDFGDILAISDDARYLAFSGITINGTNWQKSIIIYSVPQKTLTFSSNFTLVSGNRLSHLQNKIIINSHSLPDGTLIKYSTTDTPIKGLDNNQEYYVKFIDSDSFRLCRDVELQDVVQLGQTVSGTHYITNLKLSQSYEPEVVINNPQGFDQDFGTKFKFSRIDNPNPNLVTYKFYANKIGTGLFVFNLPNISSWTLIEKEDSNEFAYDYDVNGDGSKIVISDPAKVNGEVYVYSASNNYTTIQQTITAVNSQRFGHSTCISVNGNYLAIGSTLEDEPFTNQGRVRVYKYANNWATSTNYKKDDLVFFNNKVYKVLVDHTTDQVFENSRYQELSTNWTTSTSYKKDDLVFYNNKTYQVLVDHTTDQVFENSRYQELSTIEKYVLRQTIENRNAETNEEFGYNLFFANDDVNRDPKTLIIYSKKGDALTLDDSTGIITDANTTADVGRIDVYDRYETKFIFSESLPASNTVLTAPNSMAVADNLIIIGDPSYTNNDGKKEGIVYLQEKKRNTYSWQLFIEEKDKIDLTLFKKIFLYTRANNSLLTYLDIVDPTQGKICGSAEQDIKFKLYYDPATYSYKDSTFTTSVNVDQGLSWTDNYVGVLWWDLRRAKFLDSSIGDIVYNNSVWNTLFPTASIDIYEWVESSVLPSIWDELADTVEGLAEGISGQSLYGDNVYSVKITYDTLSNKSISTYYFWVKNKKLAPTSQNRKFSAIDVASLIENPKNFNIKYISFLDKNAVSLSNVKPLTDNKNVILSVQYWTEDPTNLAIHNEWKIVSDNEKTVIPKNIEEKWFDSLIGNDKNGRSLPNIGLPPKLRYGIENNPNQTMFFNRLEAVKIFIERFNYEFKSVQVDNIDLSELYLKDEIPKFSDGLYDIIKDSYDELRFVIVDTFKQATLTPIISNGKITGINIINSGFGYKSAPTVMVKGNGVDAIIKTTINSQGSISNVFVVSSGYGYVDNTELIVRPLSVLVRSDRLTLGNWSIYHFINFEWTKVKTKEYDVTDYWYFIDWYSEGYSQFTKVDYLVKGFNELILLKADIGSIVKVENVLGTDDWVLAEKISDDIALDYTKIYKIVARKNGAIQLSSNFYNFRINEQGYDGLLYDSDLYDRIGSIELRIILNALKNKILIDDRRSIYLNLFFSSIRHILHEQPFVDWVFKTSFVKVLHNVGPLRQKVNFNNDNLEDYESYIKEVKPYRTKIREYVSVYNNLENSNSLITDFDLQPYIKNDGTSVSFITQFSNKNVYINNPDLANQYPWRAWKDNLGFNVKDIVIVDSGDGYLLQPTIEIVGECTRPARIKIYISRGRVAKVDIIDQGEGYFNAPSIRIKGQYIETGREAKLIAILGNSPIRSNQLSMKFDRYTKESIDNLLNLSVNDQFIGDGTTTSFDLRYSPILDRDTFTVFINNAELFLTEYTVEKKTSQSRKYTSYYATITFKNPPADQVSIIVSYDKDFNNLNALERIKYFYKPTSGMLGIDFDQLMTGIDYGGVSVTGIGFDKPNLWDGAYSWGSRNWDAGEPTDDELYDTIIDGGNLPKLNPIYRTASGLRADDIIIDGDNFITPTTSPAPEEMLPGHIYDTLAIKVFERNTTVTSEVFCERFITDGSSKDYTITNYPNNDKAIIVKLNERLLSIDDYYFDYNNLTITLFETPEENQDLSIIGLGFNGLDMIETNSFVVEEDSEIIILDIDHQPNVRVFTVVAGRVLTNIPFKTYGSWQNTVFYKIGDEIVYQNTLFKSLVNSNRNNLPFVLDIADNTQIPNEKFWEKIQDNVDAYIKVGKIGIRFPEVVKQGDILVFSVFLSSDVSQSILTREIIISDGTSKIFNLQNFVGYSIPLGVSTIVRVGDDILNSVDQFKFTLTNRRKEYPIPLNKSDLDVYASTDYEVFIDSVKVPDAIAYTLNLLDGTITIKPNYYKENALVLVTIVKFAEYFIDNTLGYSRIRFRVPFPLGTRIEVIAMTNHDLLGINRSYLDIEKDNTLLLENAYYPILIQASGGVFYLDQEIKNSNYVWVTKNKKLLVPLTDYILQEDKKSIKLIQEPNGDDKIGIITFVSNIERTPVSFMLFKDMLNDYTYKRLSRNRTTRLIQNLTSTDKEIIIEQSTRIAFPIKESNLPGIVYINGERIEYYTRIGNRLMDLRRGTLGTGVPLVHSIGTEVNDIGFDENIPYEDVIITYNWSGEWQPAIRYFKNDVVSYNNANWLSVNGVNYDLWDSQRIYKLNQQVVYNNKLYTSIKALDGVIKNINQQPNLETDWWQETLSNITDHPSANNPNWEQTDFGSVNDSGNIEIIVVPWLPVVRSNSITNNFDKNVLDTEIFIGTTRLKKYEYTIHNAEIHPHSPEGDVNYAADFITDGVDHGTTNGRPVAFIKLDKSIPVNTRITVVRKQGTVWSDIGKSLAESNNKVSEFLKIQVAEIRGTQTTLDSTSYSVDLDKLKTDEE